MKVTLKLFAGLSQYLPGRAVRNAIELEVRNGCTLNDLIDQQKIPHNEVHLILVNGSPKQQSERLDQTLNRGDVIAMWPPVAGG